MVTDAFIRGIGGVLIHRVGQGWHILEAFEAPVGTEHKGLAVHCRFGPRKSKVDRVIR